MRTFFVTNLIMSVFLPLSTALILVGCTESEYVSTDDFLKELSIEKKAGDVDVGTMPPLDESMEGMARIRMETDELDAGLIPNDALTHKKLKVYNDGSMPLKITKIDTTCACTQGTITPENALIQGGEESWIDVVIDPRRIPGFHSEKELSIISTDPEHPVMNVTVKAQVEPEYEIGPDEIDLGDILKGESVEKRLRFRQLIERAVNVTALDVIALAQYKSLDSGFTASIEEVPESAWETPGRQEFDLVFTFGATMPVGSFTRYANLTTDIRRTNRHRLTFTGTVIAPYAVTPVYPEYAALTKAEETGGYHARFVFSAATPITIGDVSSASEKIVAVASPGASPNEAYVDVTYEGAPPKILVFDAALEVTVQVNGESYTEKIGCFLKPDRTSLGATAQHK